MRSNAGTRKHFCACSQHNEQCLYDCVYTSTWGVCEWTTDEFCVSVWYLPLPPAPVTAPALLPRCGFEKQLKFYFNIIDNVIHDLFLFLPFNSALAAGTSAVIAIHPLSYTSLLFFFNSPSFFLSIHRFHSSSFITLFPSTFVSNVTLCNVNTCRCWHRLVVHIVKKKKAVQRPLNC